MKYFIISLILCSCSTLPVNQYLVTATKSYELSCIENTNYTKTQCNQKTHEFSTRLVNELRENGY